MGLNNENAYGGALILDVEAAPISNAADFLEKPTAPSNYTKPESIATYVEKAWAEALSKCALDIDLARITAIGYQYAHMAEPAALLCRDEDEEREALATLLPGLGGVCPPRIIGWNLLGYDLLLIQRRAFYLGVEAPPIQIGKYKHPQVDDLMWTWSNEGALKFRSLGFVCKRLGIDVSDDFTGKDMGLAVAEGRWDDVRAHVIADIHKTRHVAERMGAWRPQPAEAF